MRWPGDMAPRTRSMVAPRCWRSARSLRPVERKAAAAERSAGQYDGLPLGHSGRGPRSHCHPATKSPMARGSFMLICLSWAHWAGAVMTTMQQHAAISPFASEVIGGVTLAAPPSDTAALHMAAGDPSVRPLAQAAPRNKLRADRQTNCAPWISIGSTGSANCGQDRALVQLLRN